jgi:ketosteroid isomerase-like protein
VPISRFDCSPSALLISSWTFPAGCSNPATYEGHAGLRSAISEVWEAWEDFREENERLIDVGEKVLALQTIAGRGRASGVEVRAPGALIWTLRDGLVTRVETFLDPTEARKAVALEE